MNSSEDTRNRIRSAGLKITAQRIAVLQLLEGSSIPLSHSDIAIALESHGFDKATLYRNLMDLSDAKILTRHDVGDHIWRFEISRQNEAFHPHFVCTDCGQVACLSDSENSLSEVSSKYPQTVGAVSEIVLKGHCNKCLG